MLFSSNTEVALRSAADRGRLLAAVAGLQPGAGATRYGPALKLAGSILSESALPRREAILISDFQRSGWQGGEGVRLPDGAVLTPVAITDSGKANLAIAPVSLQQSEFQNQQRITVTTGAVNHTDVAASNVEIALEIGGRAIQTRRVNVAARGSASATFDPVTVADRNVRATVRLADDALARDNVFNFVVSPENPVDVIIGERPGSARNTSLYLARAVAVSEAPRIEAKVRQADSLSSEDLAAASVVILNDAPIAQTTAERLQAFVQRGGGLFVVAGRAGELAVGRPTSCPACRAPPVDRSRGAAARLGALEYGHPLFEVFRGPRTGDFAVGALLRLSQRDARPPTAPTLARFDDGQPALLERRVGHGPRADVDVDARHDVDRPGAQAGVRARSFIASSATWARIASRRPWRTVGDVVDPGLQAPAKGVRRLARGADAVGRADLARRRRSRGARARRAGLLRVPGAGTGRRCAGRRGQQRRPGRVGPDAARSAGDRGGGARTGGRRGGRAAGRRRPTMRRNRPSASGGICCLPGCCCSAPKLSWPTG